MEKEKYYHRINNLDIQLVKGPHKNYIMINQWAEDNSHCWGIAMFDWEISDEYWYVKTFGNFGKRVDWYDFGALVNLGWKWIAEGCFADDNRYVDNY